MMEISPRVWRKIMILENITDIECSVCADPVSGHSSEAYISYSPWRCDEEDHSRERRGKRVWRQRATWGLHVWKAGMFSYASWLFFLWVWIPLRGSAPVSSWNLNWLYCGLHLHSQQVWPFSACPSHGREEERELLTWNAEITSTQGPPPCTLHEDSLTKEVCLYISLKSL